MSQIEQLSQDVRYALRALRRTPAITAIMVGTLALGIGANATMFGVLDALLLRAPPHVDDPARVVRIHFSQVIPGFGANVQRETTYRVFGGLRERSRTFEAVAAEYAAELSLGRGEAARPVRASLVSPGYFDLLGVKPARGRFLPDAEDEPAVVISDALWRSAYGADPRVLGRPVEIGRHRYVVAGIAPRGFVGVAPAPTDLWLPLSSAPNNGVGSDWKDPRKSWLQIVGRLRAGRGWKEAEAETTAEFRASGAAISPSSPDTRAILGPLQPGRGPDAPEGAGLSIWLSAMAAILLLAACVNVATLIFQRALQRQRETAIRLALGVGARRLLRQLATEALVLAAAGGCAAVAVALWSSYTFRAYLFPDGAAPERLIDARVLAATALVTLAVGVLCALLPLWQVRRADIAGALRTGERGATPSQTRVRSVLLASQVALSVMLLVGAGLFVRSARGVAATDFGFDAGPVLVVRGNLERVGAGQAEIEAFYERARERLAARPEVEAASLASVGPMSGMMMLPVAVPGRSSLPQAPGGGPFFNAVDEDYFRALEIPVVRGRPFERGGRAPAAAVNETMARLVWPGRSPVGECIRILTDPAPCWTVVAVVRDTRTHSLREPPSMQVYTPRRAGSPVGALVVRVAGRGEDQVASVRRDLAAMDPGLPYLDVQPLTAVIAPQLRPWRAGAVLLGAFGAMALALALVGMYGSVSYGVLQRRRDIGVRMAMGATPRQVLRSVMAGGARIALAGVAVGIAASLALARTLQSLLFGVGAADPPTFAAVTLLSLAACLLASYLPARRAARVDPLEALRDG
ncbi:MAG TPA: ABC transporter permease [Longimicrobium sp.]|jgi:predicted permease